MCFVLCLLCSDNEMSKLIFLLGFFFMTIHVVPTFYQKESESLLRDLQFDIILDIKCDAKTFDD